MRAVLRNHRFFFLLGFAYLGLILWLGRPALHDESEAYYNYGRNLLVTGTYGVESGISDNFREPGYGIYLALILAPQVAAEKAFGYAPSLESRLRWLVLWQAFFFLASLLVFLIYAELKPDLKHAFVFLALISPTLWGAHSDIYSETLAIDFAVLLLTLISRSDRLQSQNLILAGLLCGWLLLTKLYLMYFFPLAFLLFLAFAIRSSLRAGALRTDFFKPLLVPALALIFLAGWNLRGQSVQKREEGNHRTILQLAGKVYRHQSWNLREEWKPALLASCCLNTCAKKYGPAVCDKFTWRVSDGIGYSLMQDWKEHPERHEKNLLKEVLAFWWSTLPMQLVSSSLEVVRMVFFEAATVSPESGAPWRLFGQVWHLFGSLLLGTLAVIGLIKGRGDNTVRFPLLLVAGFLFYHVAFMAQVTNVQRYSQPVIPWIYFLAAITLSSLARNRRFIS